jgi:hypothetical protein
MSAFGFSEDQIRPWLRRLASKRLIETPHAHYREIEVPDHEEPDQFYYRATSIGIYHVRYWMGSFSFMDATSTDTPIFDPAARAEVFNLAPSFDIANRYKKAHCFKVYLDAQWHLANIAPTYFDYPALIKSQDESFTAVKKVTDRGPVLQRRGR